MNRKNSRPRFDVDALRGLRGALEHSAYLADVKARFGRKRNFMKLLA